MNIFIKRSAGEFILKSIGVESNLESLKNEVISILKKNESKIEGKELKKAVEYFELDENKYSYLEKSASGLWIEKAGYGVGTVRIWKGKKFKKVSASPVKWVRVYDKEDRGAKSSMTRLINKVKSCKSEEELYQFCMSNHALFQDDNGVDLPIMDKLRTAMEEHRNNGFKTSAGTKGKGKTENTKMKDSENKEPQIPEASSKEENPEEKLDSNKKQIKELKAKKEELNSSNRENFRNKVNAIENEDVDKQDKLQKKQYSINEQISDIDDKIRELNAENMELGKKIRASKNEGPEGKLDSKSNDTAQKTIKMFEKQIADIDTKLQMFDNNPSPATENLAKQYEKQKKFIVKQLEDFKKQNDIESEVEKTKNRSEAMKGNQNAKKLGVTEFGAEIVNTDSTSNDSKIAIAKATKTDDSFVIPANPALDNAIKTMSKYFKYVDDDHLLFKGFGIQEDYLCATNGKQAVRIKIDGLDNSFGTCVDVENKDGNYVISKSKDSYTSTETDYSVYDRGGRPGTKQVVHERGNMFYPNIARVLPESDKFFDMDKIALTNVLKELKNEKYIQPETQNNRGRNQLVQLNVENGVMSINGQEVGKTTDGETNFSIAVNYEMLENSINDGARLGIQTKRVEDGAYTGSFSVSTNVGDSVFMPMQKKAKAPDLGEYRENKAKQDEITAQKVASINNRNKESVDWYLGRAKELKTDKVAESFNTGKYTNQDLEGFFTIMNADIDKEFVNTGKLFESYKKNKKFNNMSNENVIYHNYALNKPEIKEALLKEMKKRGLSTEVKKSIFDFFEIDTEEPEEEFSDYDASSPEDFNSIQYKVAQAIKECCC